MPYNHYISFVKLYYNQTIKINENIYLDLNFQLYAKRARSGAQTSAPALAAVCWINRKGIKKVLKGYLNGT